MNKAAYQLDEDQKLQLCLERDRLLSDQEFERSPTMSKLLRFLVDHRLSADPVPLKAYTIAVDALDRDESFDTEADSYPRVQISRLRRVLDNFYLREGGENRLSIPLNNYEISVISNTAVAATGHQLETSELIGIEAPVDEPESEHSSAVQQSGQFNKQGWSRMKAGIAIAVVAISLALVAGYFWLLRPTQKEIAYPAVIVADTSGVVNEITRMEAEASKAYLISSLVKFEQLRVWSREGIKSQAKLYTLESSILDETGERVQFQLTDNGSNELIWSEQVTIDSSEQLEAKLASVVIHVAGPYGAIEQAELSRYRNDYSPGYPCILQFHQFMRDRDPAVANSVRKCVIKSVRQFSDDPYLLSMLAAAKGVSQRFGSDDKIGPPAMEIARRAVQLDRHSALANFAVAQVAFFEGDCDTGAAWGKRAVELNPLNSRIAGYLGLGMLGCNMPGGEEYAERALEMDSNTDLVVAAVVALYKLQNGDALGSQQLSQQYMAGALRPEPGLEITYILSTATLGNKSEARAMWKKHAARYGFSEDTPVSQVLSSWIANPNLIDEIALAFDKVELY